VAFLTKALFKIHVFWLFISRALTSIGVSLKWLSRIPFTYPLLSMGQTRNMVPKQPYVFLNAKTG